MQSDYFKFVKSKEYKNICGYGNDSETPSIKSEL